MCIFALARTTLMLHGQHEVCCELLQNVYLCISTYNVYDLLCNSQVVVNCFKMCIFALARTTERLVKQTLCSCELLQNVYLCISTYNGGYMITPERPVVNCFKMCIFALARTTIEAIRDLNPCCELLQNVYLCISTYNRQRWHQNQQQLWIASKCVSLH